MILHQINKIPTQHDLIPNLAVLDRLLIEKSDNSKVSAIQRETEQLPYYLKGAFSALLQMELARIKAVETLNDPMFEKNSRFVLPPEHADPLSFAFDFYLFCMRRVGDALIPYVQRCPGNLSLPPSMTDLVKGLKEDKWKSIDDVVKDTLLQHWDSIGWKLTGYRDQATHKAIIISNCVAFSVDEGKKALKAMLPDNPEEKSPSKIKYDPGVPLMAFSLDGFAQLTQTVNVLVERMIDLLAPKDTDVRSKGIVSLTMRGAPVVMEPKIVGEPVPYPTNIQNLISSAVGCKYAIPSKV